MKPPPAAVAPAPTLLVVDDTPANLMLIVDCLERNGFQVAVAQDGEECRQRARLIQPALILLDVMMPGPDGFETCRRLKADEVTRDIPVVFMTALAEAENKLVGFEAGGADYVTKPIDPAEVLARVRVHLSLRATREQLAQRNRELHASNRRLEDAHHQLLQAEKMASIGQLASGVAHEINNPVGFVYSNLASLDEYIRELLELVAAYERSEPLIAVDRALREEIESLKQRIDLAYLRTDVAALVAESREGLQRVTRIVRDLREFSHVGDTEWQLADLHRGLDSTLNLIDRELRAKARVVRDYGVLPAVECQPLEINQVFLNLLLNARDAIAAHGEISVRTGTEGARVWIEIADTGRGIAAENLSRIFDPFFTTKPVGQGTGLGLSLAYGIVLRHGGSIEVASQPGAGSRFRVYLPIRQIAPSPPQPSS